MGLQGKVATNDTLTNAFENSHENLLDRLAKKPLMAALVKFEQGGVLFNDSREVSCGRQREIR